MRIGTGTNVVAHPEGRVQRHAGVDEKNCNSLEGPCNLKIKRKNRQD
jgi:hypothetical protein